MPATTPPPEEKRSIFWPLVLGGMIAGGIGFAASELNVFNTRVDTDRISQSLDAQGERLAALEAVEPTAPETPDLSGIEAGIASIETMVGEFEERLKELEGRPVVAGDGSAQYAQDLAALQTSVEEQKAEIDRLLENAQSIEEATSEAAQRADVQAALAKIMSAMTTGSSFESEVGDLQNSGISDVPEALAGPAADGVATLLKLQTDYPDQARAALSTARASGADDGEAGLGGFLKRQLGARSVAPRDGAGPDAVLSRAEAAVRDGQISQALTEIETLPPEAQDAMADWIAAARARADAEAAVQDLSQRLTAN